MDRQKNIELKEKHDQIKKLENDYSNANRIRGLDLLRYTQNYKIIYYKYYI